MESRRTYLKILVNLIVVVSTVILAIILVPRLFGFFRPFFIGWIIALIADPLVRFLENRVKILRKHSTAIIIVFVLGIITLIVYFLIIVIAKQLTSLINDLPEIFEGFRVEFVRISDELLLVSNGLPEGIQLIIDKLIQEIDGLFFDMFKGLDINSLSFAKTFAKSIIEAIFVVIITILSAYFFIVNKDDVVEGIQKITPEGIAKGWNMVANNFKLALGGYFKAMLKLMVIVFGILFVGLSILKIRYAFILAITIAVLDFMPILGTGAILWPWALVDMVMGNYSRAIALMVIYIVCQVVKQVVQPKLVADSIGLDPLATLIFLFIGYKLYGVLGMIIAVPIGMVIVSIYRVGVFDRLIRGFKIIARDINEFRKF